MTDEQNKDIEFVKSFLVDEIKSIQVNSDKVKNRLSKEVFASIVYLKIFSDYLGEKKFENLEEAWRFMNDIRGIIEKIFYVNQYLKRINEYSASK